jgi:hypothetical protein
MAIEVVVYSLHPDAGSEEADGVFGAFFRTRRLERVFTGFAGGLPTWGPELGQRNQDELAQRFSTDGPTRTDRLQLE